MSKLVISIKPKQQPVVEKKTPYRCINDLSDDEFIKLAKDSTSMKEMAKHLGITSTRGIRSRINRLDSAITAHFIGNKSYIESLSDDELLKLVKESSSYYDLAVKIGYSANMGYSILPHIRKILADKNISTDHFGSKPTTNKTKLAGHKKQTLIKKHNNTCSICGLSDVWNGLPIKMHVDHINGDSWDHKEENLRLLCPNCHSQQDTTCSKNKSAILFYKKRAMEASKKIEFEKCACGADILTPGAKMCEKCHRSNCTKVVDRPTIPILLEKLKKEGYVAVGKEYGVTDNAVRGWFRFGGFFPPSRKELKSNITVDELKRIGNLEKSVSDP